MVVDGVVTSHPTGRQSLRYDTKEPTVVSEIIVVRLKNSQHDTFA